MHDDAFKLKFLLTFGLDKRQNKMKMEMKLAVEGY
jgi:hypothetical protein